MVDDQETEQRDTQQEEKEQQNGSDGDQSEEQAKAQQVEEETEQAKEKVKELEENPPEKLEDWPDDKAKYETFGGPEGPHSYEEGPEKKLGPSSLRHREDGKVEIEGDEVDNPDEYKTEPIPGGPTDPDAPRTLARWFADGSVGSVCGRLLLVDPRRARTSTASTGATRRS